MEVRHLITTLSGLIDAHTVVLAYGGLSLDELQLLAAVEHELKQQPGDKHDGR